MFPRMALLPLLMLASATTPTHASDTAASGDAALAPVTGLARTPPTRTRFAEARFSPLLDRPLLVHGQLSWQGGDRLERHVDDPYVETTRIGDGEVTVHRAGRGTRHFRLDRAPPLRALLDSLVAVLTGDPARLRALFDPTLERHGEGGANWTLTLVPKSPQLAHSLARIQLDGGSDQLRCIAIEEAGGSTSIDLLGPLAAKLPAQLTRAGLTALCRHAD